MFITIYVRKISGLSPLLFKVNTDSTYKEYSRVIDSKESLEMNHESLRLNVFSVLVSCLAVLLSNWSAT